MRPIPWNSSSHISDKHSQLLVQNLREELEKLQGAPVMSGVGEEVNTI
jgi:hypothetical protein